MELDWYNLLDLSEEDVFNTVYPQSNEAIWTHLNNIPVARLLLFTMLLANAGIKGQTEPDRRLVIVFAN